MVAFKRVEINRFSINGTNGCVIGLCDTQCYRGDKGETLYRERIALPAEAKVVVQLLDVSKMDVPAIVMAERVQQGAATPTPFSFAIGSDQFQPGHTYAIGARIMLGDKLLFINTQAYHIDLNSTEPMTILLEKVGG